MNLGDLQSIASCMADMGATRLYAKELAENDNGKNQIYLGPSFEVLQLLPFSEVVPTASKDSPILHAPVNLGWLGVAGGFIPARNAKLVLYPQYPEVRLSGFVQGCKAAPARWFNSKLDGRTRGRILFLGVTSDGRILAHLGTPGSPLALEFCQLRRQFLRAGVLADLSRLLGCIDTATSERILLEKLADIHKKGWIDAKRLLATGEFTSCKGTNCGGCTLEAELGIGQNGRAEPDFLGWEIKQHATTDHLKHGTGAITLFTPEPDGGEYLEGVQGFVEKYGSETVREGISYFQGIHRSDQEHSRTGLRLCLDGFDRHKGIITKSDGKISLVTANGDEAASWSFAKLFNHWCRKHNRAAYVPAQKGNFDRALQYRYGRLIKLCRGTDALLLLKAVSSGDVYYDPGIKLDRGSRKIHRRSQFRIKFSDMDSLYRETLVRDAINGQTMG